MKNIFLVLDADGVAGIRSSRASRDNVRPVGKIINEFAFSRVAPLVADDRKRPDAFQKLIPRLFGERIHDDFLSELCELLKISPAKLFAVGHRPCSASSGTTAKSFSG